MRWREISDRFRGPLSLAAGLSMPLAFAPFELFFIAPLSVAALFLLWHDVSPRVAARSGFFYGCGMFLAGTYWTYVSVHTFGKAPAALAVFLVIAMVAILAAYIAALGYITRRWLRAPGCVNWLWVLPGAWVLMEWVKGWAFSGFPWLSLGYSQIDMPLAGLAPVTGIFGLSWAVVVTAGAVCALVLGDRRTRVVAAISVVGLWALAAALGTVAWTAPNGDSLRVSLIQGGIPQDRKWLPEQRQPTLDLYRQLTELSRGSQLVVWPEAAVPAVMGQVSGYLDSVAAQAGHQGTDVLTGVLRRNPATGQLENSLIVLGPEGQVYSKRHLVPFGEYFPVPDFVRERMRLMNLPHSDFAAGADDQPLLHAAGQRIAANICYEDVFGEEQLPFLPEATLLVNVSNDAWFGDSIAPHQHLQIARMRALEAGRYLLRATNNGITAIIDPDGRIEQRSPQFRTHVLTAVVEPREGATPYVRFGNWLIVLLAAAATATGVLVRQR